MEILPLAHAFVPELVVPVPFVGSAQYLVRFCQFLEFFLGVFFGVPVGMILHRQFAIRFFNFIVGRGFRNAENLVIISLCHKSMSLIPVGGIFLLCHDDDTRMPQYLPV